MFLEQIIVLALIQGITEFLPVSSSGHLILVPALTGWKDQGVTTDAITNVGTLLATTIYFWRDVVAMLRGLWDLLRRQNSALSSLALNIIIGTIPIVILGGIFQVTGLDEKLRLPSVVAINAIVFGIVLYVADTYGLMRNTIANVKPKSALFFGLAQMMSLVPGTSRSGITISAGRAMGFTRQDAARFSFLLAIPANALASIVKIGGAVKAGDPINGTMIMCGILTFFVGLITIAFLMRMLRTMSFLPFVLYRVALGVFLLGLIYWGVPLGAVN
jgi:undecaprenyl-diphosphatase